MPQAVTGGGARLALAGLAVLAGCAHNHNSSKEEVREIERELSNKPSLIKRERQRMRRARPARSTPRDQLPAGKSRQATARRRGISLDSGKGGAGPNPRATCLARLEKKYTRVRAVALTAGKISGRKIASVDQFSESTVLGQGRVKVFRSEGRVEVPRHLFLEKLSQISKNAAKLRKKTGARIADEPRKERPTALARLSVKLKGKEETTFLHKALSGRDEQILARIVMRRLLEEGHAVVQVNGRPYRGKKLYRVLYRRDPPGCRSLLGSRYFTEQCEVVFETVEREVLAHPCLLR